MRGIGVADRVSTSTPDPQRLDLLLVLHAEALLLVDDEQPQVVERDVVGEEPVGADDDVDRAAGQVGDDAALLLGGEEPGEDLDPHRVVREPLPERLTPCWLASRVVGTSTATCLLSCTALNAARTATSVLPKPTSPHTSRSIGTGRSMSALTSSIAWSWSGVSSNGNASSTSRCHGRVGR